MEGRKNSGLKKKLVMILLGIILAVIALLVTLYVHRIQREKKYENLVSTGDKYLEELDYEKAEAAFLEAIDIKPREGETYIKLSDIYLSNNEVEKAKEIVEKAAKNVAESEKQQFEELQKEWNDLETYEWIVQPEIEADDIYYLRDNQEIAYSQNELKRQKFSVYAVIEKDQKRGLIKNDGTVVDGIKYTYVFVIADINIGNPYVLYDPDVEKYFYLDEDMGEMKEAGEYESMETDLWGGIFYYADELRNILDSRTSSGEKTEIPEYAIPVQKAESVYGSSADYEAWVQGLSEQYAIYYKNKLTTDFTYEECGSDSSGILAVEKDGKWGYVNEEGKLVIPIEYDASWDYYSAYDIENPNVVGGNITPYCYAASEGYVPLVKGGKWEMRNVSGQLVIASGVFEKICPVYDGKCWVKKNGKWGVIQLNKAETNPLLSETEERFQKKKELNSQQETDREEKAEETQPVSEERKQLSRDEVIQLVTAYYNEALSPDDGGTYIVFDDEVQETATGYGMFLRYQMSDEMADEIAAGGGTPSANRLVGTVSVNIQTGEVTMDMGDSWNLY